MGWWVWAVVVLVLVVAYLTWLAGRVTRLHRRAESAAAALEASLVRRAAAAALLADELPPQAAAELRAAAQAALDAGTADREVAENDLTRVLRRLPAAVAERERGQVVTTASRRVSLARQLHTDVVRDARAVRRRIPVRLLRLARRHPAPAYFDIDDPVLDEAGQLTERTTG